MEPAVLNLNTTISFLIVGCICSGCANTSSHPIVNRVKAHQEFIKRTNAHASTLSTTKTFDRIIDGASGVVSIGKEIGEKYRVIAPSKESTIDIDALTADAYISLIDALLMTGQTERAASTSREAIAYMEHVQLRNHRTSPSITADIREEQNIKRESRRIANDIENGFPVFKHSGRFGAFARIGRVELSTVYKTRRGTERKIRKTCTGTIVSKNVVLTSSDCVLMSVRGTDDLEDGTYTVAPSGLQFFLDETYAPYGNDTYSGGPGITVDYFFTHLGSGHKDRPKRWVENDNGGSGWALLVIDIDHTRKFRGKSREADPWKTAATATNITNIEKVEPNEVLVASAGYIKTGDAERILAVNPECKLYGTRFENSPATDCIKRAGAPIFKRFDDHPGGPPLTGKLEASYTTLGGSLRIYGIQSVNGGNDHQNGDVVLAKHFTSTLEMLKERHKNSTLSRFNMDEIIRADVDAEIDQYPNLDLDAVAATKTIPKSRTTPAPAVGAGSCKVLMERHMEQLKHVMDKVGEKYDADPKYHNGSSSGSLAKVYKKAIESKFQLPELKKIIRSDVCDAELNKMAGELDRVAAQALEGFEQVRGGGACQKYQMPCADDNR